jgi:hypothetical protein
MTIGLTAKAEWVGSTKETANIMTRFARVLVFIAAPPFYLK